MPWIKVVYSCIVSFSYPLCVFGCRKSVERHLTGGEELNASQRIALSFVIVAVTIAVGILSPNILVPIGVTGATTATACMFLFPSISFIYARRSEGYSNWEGPQVRAWLLFVAGTIVGVVATIVSVMPDPDA